MAILGLTNKQLMIGGAAVVGGLFILPQLFGGNGGIGGKGTRIVMLNQRDRPGGGPGGAQSPTITSPLIDFGDSKFAGNGQPSAGSGSGGNKVQDLAGDLEAYKESQREAHARVRRRFDNARTQRARTRTNQGVPPEGGKGGKRVTTPGRMSDPEKKRTAGNVQGDKPRKRNKRRGGKV